MTSTSVKDVSTVMQAMPTNASVNVTKASEGGFKEVLDRQTGQNKPEEVTQPKKDVDRKEIEPGKKTPEEAVKVPEEKEAEVVKDSAKEPEKLEEMDEKAVEQAMEVLQTAAGELITQIAETFDMSVEEVNAALEQLGMEPMDVLQTDKLGNLLLELGGAEDSLALLTNEGLYQDFKAVMNVQSNILTESAETLGVDEDRLEQMIGEMKNVAMTSVEEVPVEVETKMPVIEVSESDEISLQSTEDGDDVTVMATKDTQSITDGTQIQETRESKGDTNHNSDGSRQAQEGNVILQQTQDANPVMQSGQSTTESFVSNMETQDIMRQIMDYMKIQIKPDMSNLEMQLHPASLGTLQIQVASKGGVLTAQFVTENEAVKAVLESQMVQLKENFAQQGVKVEAIEVTVQTHQFESNLEQGRGREQEMPERRNRTRRINLDGSLMADDMEDLNEEEMLAAQMMSANGTTVDYIA